MCPFIRINKISKIGSGARLAAAERSKARTLDACRIILHVFFYVFSSRLFFTTFLSSLIDLFQNTTRVSNSFDSDQVVIIGPDLRPNCLQKLSVEIKIIM